MLALTVAGCSSAAPRPAGSRQATPSESAASCALTPAQFIRRAPTEFLAIALAGPSRSVGSADALVSPARMQVVRWLKGDGPRVVAVQTGMSAAGRVSEDGILPHHGERWRIVSMSRRAPYATSACLGSVRLPGLTMGAGAPS